MTQTDPQNALTEGLKLLEIGALPEALWRLEEARDLGEEGLALQKALAETSFGLGFYKDAEAAFKAVLKVEPESLPALQGLGRVAMKKRDLKAARKYFEKARGPMALVELGLLEEMNERPKIALEHYLKAAGSDPGLYKRILTEADKYLYLGLAGMARFYLTRAERVAPGGPDAPYGIGFRYFSLGAMADATRCFKVHLERVPSLKGFRDLADVYEKTNRPELALETLATPLKYFPDDPRVNYLAGVCEMRLNKTKAAIKRLEKVLAKTGADHLTEAEILNGLGRAFDAEKNYDKAAEYFAASKTALKKTEDFGAIDASVLPRLIADQKDLKAKARAGAGGDEPVFLLGFHRTGTTLIQHILEGSDKVETAEERGILEGVLANLDRKEGGYPAALESLSAADLDRLRRLYGLWAGVHGKTGGDKLFIDKNPLNTLHPVLISMLFPKAKIIFALRNPYAVALSCWMQNFTLNPATANMLGLGEIVNFYKSAMDLWQAVSKGRKMDVHTVRYEDLVADIEGETKALCGFLGLDYKPAMVEFHKNAAKREEINTASYSQVIRPLFKEGVARWENYRSVLEPYRETLDPLCKAFGYPSLD